MNYLIDCAHSLVSELYTLLRDKNLTVATAESCTGGLLGALLTHPAGASRYYLGGVVSYANEVKKELLGVKNGTLASVGAVSSETACEMSKGAKKAIGASLAVSITGIAGPGGESTLKPQGLVYISTYDGKELIVKEHHFTGDRATVRLKSAEAALTMLIAAAKAYRN